MTTYEYLISNSSPVPAEKPQPVELKLPADLKQDLLWGDTSLGQSSVLQRVNGESDGKESVYVGILVPHDGEVITVRDVESGDVIPEGIRIYDDTQEKDAVCRLDTGYFIIEMCRGTGMGEGASKWGIRHFMAKAENVDLLSSGNNAIGGFYGPFFTPENGLINPPEHVIADVDLIENGPNMSRYRLAGRIPDGLLPELQGKRFTVTFTFYRDLDLFDRVYDVDHFETEIDGRSVVDRITVGDEFERGEGELVFDRFASYNPIPYRSGDPYAGFLKDEVRSTLSDETEVTERFAFFKELLDRDLENAHWDLYWRLFSHWENAIEPSALNRRLGHVRSLAHRASDLNDRPWVVSKDAIDVSAHEEQTVFPASSSCTAEFDSRTGRCMIWLTTQSSGAFQIVQRPQSGWVNWGTNGENECPALPIGTKIRTIYGPFGDRWRDRADESRFDGVRVAPRLS